MSPAVGPSKQSVLAGRWLIVIAALLWSTSGFFARAPVFDAWPADWRGPALAFYRAAFAGLILIPVVRKVSWNITMLPMVIFFAAMNWTYLSSMVLGPPANAIWLQNTAPAWVMLFGFAFMGERFTRRDLVMVGLAMTGVVLIVGMQLKASPPAATFLAIFSGLMYAGVILCLRRLRDHDPAWLISLNHIVAAVTLIPGAIMVGAAPTANQWAFLAFFGPLQMGIPYLLFARGIRGTPGHEAALLAILEPILLPVWIYVAWGHLPGYEAPPWWTLIGAGFILSGLLYRYWPRPGELKAVDAAKDVVDIPIVAPAEAEIAADLLQRETPKM